VNDIQKQIIQKLQTEFPLEPRPFDIIAQKLGISLDELFAEIQQLIDAGVIRRLGVSLDSNKLGYRSILAAIAVPEDRIQDASERIHCFSEITHSYLRSDPFNIWFTIIAPSDERIAAILDALRNSLNLKPSEVLHLPMKRLFKLDARFYYP
jgi:DNA-binding Lrp family transcriptional regulator